MLWSFASFLLYFLFPLSILAIQPRAIPYIIYHITILVFYWITIILIYIYIYIHFSLSFPSLYWFLPRFSSLLLSLLFYFSDNTFSFLLPILPSYLVIFLSPSKHSFRISLSDSHFIFSSNITALLYVSTLNFILLVSSFAIYLGVFQSNPKIHFKYLSCTASMLFHSFHSQISVPYIDNRTFVFFYYNLFEFLLINSPNLFHCHRCLFVIIRNEIHILNW